MPFYEASRLRATSFTLEFQSIGGPEPTTRGLFGPRVYHEGVSVEDPWHALRLRMLQIDAAVWHHVVEDYERMTLGDGGAPADVNVRLLALTQAYARHSPHAAPFSGPFARTQCFACLDGVVEPLLARQPGPLVYGRCRQCSHGMLLSGPNAARDLHLGSSYYAQRTATGVGYDRYEDEREYREKKAEALLARIEKACRSGGAKLETLVEVGSAFGFSRAAAERRGYVSMGVDLNPEAARASERIYGFRTFTGTLAAALEDPASGLRAGAADVVLYQFVLEHVAEPVAELASANSALRSGGIVAVLVPSMEAKELDVFGASYRSLRADHLHLFSRASAVHLLRRAGFAPVVVESGGSVQLLRGFLSEPEIESLDEAGLGPDLFLVAKKTL